MNRDDTALLPHAADSPPQAATGDERPDHAGWLERRFELSRHGAAANVRPMEGLRGFAVFIVFLVHYVSTLEPWIAPGGALHVVADAMHTIGTSGVDLFFVLSGYLIYGSLMARPQRFGPFMLRRWQRIYPAFLAVFALYVALSLALPGQSRIPDSAPAAARYLLANLLLLPGLLPIEPLITVAWSLSYEMFYYLAVPALIALLGLRRWPRRRRVVLFVGLALAIGIACGLRGGPVQLVMFFAGMLLHEALAKPALPAPGGGLTAAALVAGFAAMLLPVPGPAGYAAKVGMLFVAFFLLCHECFSRPHGLLACGFSWTPLRWLGNMSYSYYLLHGLALKAAFIVLARAAPVQAIAGWQFWALLAPMFALSLLPAALLFLVVERPLSLAPRRAHGRRSGLGAGAGRAPVQRPG